MKTQVVNMQLMKKMNTLKVLNYIRNNPNTLKTEIAKNLGFSPASITNITTSLLEKGLIYQSGTEDVGRVGRKGMLYKFNASCYKLICIFVFESYVKIYVCDLVGKIEGKYDIPIKGLSVRELAPVLTQKLSEILSDTPKENFLAIGVTMSGLVLGSSMFILSSKLKWKTYDIKTDIEEKTGLPVFVDNISPVRALAYYCSTDKYVDKNSLFIDMENGIGAVQFYNNELVSSTLGEVGHTTVKIDGEPCFCGNRGCLEAMCSPKRLLSLYESASGNAKTPAQLEKLYQMGDKAAIFAVEECGKYLGIGLGNLVNLFNPNSIVINNEDFINVPSVINEALSEMKKRVIPALLNNLEIDIVAQTENAGVFGLAHDVCDKMFSIK